MSPTITPTISGRNERHQHRRVERSGCAAGRASGRGTRTAGRASGSASAPAARSRAESTAPRARARRPRERSSSRRSSGSCRPRRPADDDERAARRARVLDRLDLLDLGQRVAARAARHAATRGASSSCSSVLRAASSAGISPSRRSIAVTAPRNESPRSVTAARMLPDTLAAEERLHGPACAVRSHDHAADRVAARPAPPRARSDRRARSAAPRAARRRPPRRRC